MLVDGLRGVSEVLTFLENADRVQAYITKTMSI